MSVAEFFDSLKDFNKELVKIVISILFMAPLSYSDLWIVAPGFRALEPFPQSILALALSVICAIIGYLLALWILGWTYEPQRLSHLSVLLSLFPIFWSTVILIFRVYGIGYEDTLQSFITIFFFACLAIFLLTAYTKFRNYARREKEERSRAQS